MEWEMKAKVTQEQIANLLREYLPLNPKQSEFITKKDTYYSFGGIAPKKPDRIVRTREEHKYNFKQVLAVSSPFVDYLNEKDPVVWNSIAKKIINLLRGYSMDFLSPSITQLKPQIVLTVKEKETIGDAEKNKEFEGELPVNTAIAFNKFVEMANFKPYFRKDKNSVSFYTEEEGKLLHCELVSVNGSDVYLEVEYCSDKSDFDAIPIIKHFMKNKIGVESFDRRSWVDIIEEMPPLEKAKE